MSVIELLKARASIRKYNDKLISEDKLDLIAKQAFTGPSGHNARPVEVIVVTEKNTLEILALSRVGSANMLNNASACIVVIADNDLSTTCIEDASIAMENMHIAAFELGIGSCWIQIRGRECNNKENSEDYVRRALNIPNNYLVEAILSLGYPEEEFKPKAITEKIHKNNF